MQNLSKKIIDILKVEPNIEHLLLPLKAKWDKGPRRQSLWNQLFKILNSEIAPTHPRRLEIQNLFIKKSRQLPRKPYTFESPSPVETIVGILPEYMESLVRKNDRTQVDLAKLAIEAKLTHNEELMVEIARRSEKLDIAQKKIWYDIKTHFNIWKVSVPTSYFIRAKGTLLALTSTRLQPPRANLELPGLPPESYMIKMDNETLRNFLKFFNISPPPPENEGE